MGAGYLNIHRNASGKIINYARWLNMDDSVLKTSWTEPKSTFERQVTDFYLILRLEADSSSTNSTYFCSNPSRTCMIHTVASTPGALSETFSFSSLPGHLACNITCLNSNTIRLRGSLSSPGMAYEILVQICQLGPTNYTANCVSNT